ncbi:hypothetical protein TNIN_267011 [Trichonephila inaurata madagascariensis]|uniref:Uncharacterized protein n=1 Tax=Trichonephila inaurata madagascariensis TaxID=2747483 RepID=A0A8X6XPY3_9ARAC|nr:hypothetical protein TNIN_267011 [Trichonephila inaurata madagascariensis]
MIHAKSADDPSLEKGVPREIFSSRCRCRSKIINSTKRINVFFVTILLAIIYGKTPTSVFSSFGGRLRIFGGMEDTLLHHFCTSLQMMLLSVGENRCALRLIGS